MYPTFQNEALMKDDIVKTQKAIEYSRDQFASIKLTAEKKLEASNKEIILLREQNEIGKFMVNSKVFFSFHLSYTWTDSEGTTKPNIFKGKT